MPIKTFRGGVFLEEHKESTVLKKIKAIPAPPELILPVRQHLGSPSVPIVQAGDAVKLGQLVAEPGTFISSSLHSPVSGTIKSIKNFFNPVYGKSPAFVIENDKKDEPFLSGSRTDIENLSNEELIEIIKKAGIVGMGGAAFPTHVKLSVPKGKKIDSFIANGAECEPYLTSDYRLMVEKTEQILKGIKLAAKIVSASNIIIAIEENKLGAVLAMEKALKNLRKDPSTQIKIVVLKTKYPQGGEKQLINATLKREVPPGKLPFDIGVVVQNVGTCFAIYEAICEGKPLIERCVTFTGDAIKESGNFLVRLGTPLNYIIDYLGGTVGEVAKIITGGPMMGIAQYSPEIPIMKGITGVLFLSKKRAGLFEESPCIRCAKCIDICPLNLMPTEVMRMVKYSKWHRLDEFCSTDCMECGACTYLCPSKIPLTQYMKLAKAKAMEIKK